MDNVYYCLIGSPLQRNHGNSNQFIYIKSMIMNYNKDG